MSNFLKIFFGIYIIGVIFLLIFVFPGKIILGQSFSLGLFEIHYYGVVIALSILSAAIFSFYTSKKISDKKDVIDNLFIAVIVCGFIGARIYHVFTDLDFYLSYPQQILYVWNGGLGIFGAILGGLIGLYIYNRLFIKQEFLKVVDWLVPGVILGQAIGRFGNLFNYELYGIPTTLPWKMFVPQNFQTTLYEVAQYYFHPLFLYESLACLLIFLVLLRYNDLSSRWDYIKFPGSKLLIWLVLYGIVRFNIELLRVDHSYIGIFNINLVISLLMIIIGTIVYLRKIYATKSS